MAPEVVPFLVRVPDLFRNSNNGHELIVPSNAKPAMTRLASYYSGGVEGESVVTDQ